MATKSVQRGPPANGNVNNSRAGGAPTVAVNARAVQPVSSYRSNRSVRSTTPNRANANGVKPVEKLRVTVFKANGTGKPDEQGKAIIVPDTWSEFIKVRVTIYLSKLTARAFEYPILAPSPLA
eukprot:1997703-Rhodomonas_salina.1